MEKILSDNDMQQLSKLQKRWDTYTNKVYDKIGNILNPILKKLDEYSIEQIQNLIDTMPPLHFYRAELRVYLKKRREEEKCQEK